MSDRIDGWKAIGSYFGRDRTTAMRWAEQRGLPVHRVPGGKRASVYALKAELQAWLTAQSDSIDEEAPSPATAAPVRKPRHWLLLFALPLLIAAAAFAMWAIWSPPQPSEAVLPKDPEVARLYLQARDDWAQRKAASIDRAIAGLEEVTRRDPGFAPAWASLADAFLLAREFGSQSDEAAFPKARAAVERALAIDPHSHAAHRARGFILYWWEQQPGLANTAFRRALELSPRDAQTHFWYGNALSDSGAHAAGLRELDAARLLEPGSVAIQTDLAWAQWSAGRRDDAIAALERLRTSNPDFAIIHECIGQIRLAEGDYAGYVAAFSEVAQLRGNPEMSRQARAFEAALAEGVPAVQRALLRSALDEIAQKVRHSHAWPAFLASTAHNRAQLVAILRTAAARGERWGMAGFVARIASRWSSDPEISALLARVRQRPMG